MLESFIFYPASILLIIFAIMAVYTEKVVYSLLCAIVVFFITGIIFFIAGAEYNAVIQLAIYGLAVPILFAIALMFTNTRFEKNTITSSPRHYVMYFAMGLILLAFVYLILISLNIFEAPIFAPEQAEINSIKMFDAITNGFLKTYIIPFEMISLLLLVVVVGVADNAK